MRSALNRLWSNSHQTTDEANYCNNDTNKMLTTTHSGGQSLEDKLAAMKYFIAGQGISFVTLKATTSELLGPKKKHLNYLVLLTNEPNVSIPNLVKHLMRRAMNPEWTITFKSLITMHHLMCYGNEKFIQNLASSTTNNRSFNRLSAFVDWNNTLGYDMSTFVRRYSRYVHNKIQTYRSLGTDFCRTKISAINANGISNFPYNRTYSEQSPVKLRRMRLDKLLLTLPLIQEQFDTLLAFDASPNDLNNGIINAAFLLLFKDFVKLYIAYQSAINRLLELYFSVVQVKRAKELLAAYKKFLVRMDKVNDFISVVDSVGLDKSTMPNLSRAPTSMSLKVLEKHIEFLEQNGCRRSTLERLNGSGSMMRRQSSSTIELPDYVQSALATPINRGNNNSNNNESSYGLLVRSNSIQQRPAGIFADGSRRALRQRSLQSTPMKQQDCSLPLSTAGANNNNNDTTVSHDYSQNPLCTDLLSPLAVARLTCYKQKKQQQRRANELSRLDARFEELLDETTGTGNGNSLESELLRSMGYECATVVEQDDEPAKVDDDNDTDNDTTGAAVAQRTGDGNNTIGRQEASARSIN